MKQRDTLTDIMNVMRGHRMTGSDEEETRRITNEKLDRYRGSALYLGDNKNALEIAEDYGINLDGINIEQKTYKPSQVRKELSAAKKAAVKGYVGPAEVNEICDKHGAPVAYFVAKVNEGAIDAIAENLRGSEGVRSTDSICFNHQTGQLIVTLPEVDRTTWQKTVRKKLEGIVGGSIIGSGEVGFRNDPSYQIAQQDEYVMLGEVRYEDVDNLQGAVYVSPSALTKQELKEELSNADPKVLQALAEKGIPVFFEAAQGVVKRRYHGKENMLEQYSPKNNSLSAMSFQQGNVSGYLNQDCLSIFHVPNGLEITYDNCTKQLSLK